jgi:predicted transposase YdaD
MLLTEWNWDDALAVREEEGREKVYQDKLEIAKKLLKKRWSVEETVETVELDVETVRKLSGEGRSGLYPVG